MSPNEIQQVLLRHVQAENAHDLESTLATLHPDCVFEDVALGRVYRGHAGAASYYRTWWDAFELRFRPGEAGLQHLTADGTVIAEGQFFGRHVGAFEGRMPSHWQVEFRFCVVVAFREGLMAGERFYYDRSTLWTQLEGGA